MSSLYGNFLNRVWKDEPGKWFFISTKSRNGDWSDHPFKRSQRGKVVEDFVASNLDKDLYFCPHGFAKRRRLKRYAEPGNWLYADLDEADPRNHQQLLPTFAIESSPGRFVGLWRLTDALYTEELNRRLTYGLGADPGGWDLSQVLRLPGTQNFKYESAPRVKLMWSDGPTWLAKSVSDLLPKEKTAVHTDREIAHGIYKKYEKHLEGWFRRTIFNKQSVKPGKRSEVLWKLNNTLREAGATSDEIFEILRVSPWNKFVKRRDGDEQLRREIDKGLTQHFGVVDDENPREEIESDEDALEYDDEKPYQFLATPMSEVQEEKLDWVWYPYLARGELTILEGDPGLGKSYLAQMVSAAVCDGKKLPCVRKAQAMQGKVAYFDIENTAGTVTKKRLVMNGCEKLGNFFQEQEPFSVGDDDTLDEVYDAIDKLRPTLVVFDTLNTYMAGTDTHQSTDTQKIFKRFADIARRFKCAVMVLRHLTKGNKGVISLYRGQGSIAFSGLARVVLTIGRMPDDPEKRVMAVTKLNVAKVPKSLTFTISELPSTLKDDDRSKFVWGDFVNVTADQIVDSQRQEANDEEEQTVDWLRSALLEGPKSSDKLIRMAEPRGISEMVLYRAATALGVEKTKTRDGTMWSMPMGGDAREDAGE